MVSDLVRSGGNGFAATHYAPFNVANKLAAALGVFGALTALAFIGFLPGAAHGLSVVETFGTDRGVD